MANLIQIKRSTNSAVPSSLGEGELAFASNGDILYIGAADGANTVTAIAGSRNPGTLTANQALVANSTLGIDKVITANLVPTNLQANGSFGTDGQLLFSNSTGGVYWGDNTETLALLTDTNITTPADGAMLLYDNDTSKWIDNVMSGDATLADTGALTLVSTGVSAASYGDANSVGSFTVDAKGRLTAASSVDIDHDTLLNFVADEHIAHSGITLTAGDGLTGGGDITTSRSFAVTAGDGVVANSTGVHVLANTGVTSNSTGVFIGQAVGTSDNVTFNDLVVSGNLDINGTLTTIDTTTLSVSDSLIELASDNSADTLDLGFYGNYNDGSARYAGLARDASDNGKFKLFDNLTVEPTTTVGTAEASYNQATLVAYVESSALIANSTVTNITANSTVSVALTANTLSLTTALPGTSGGTGLASYSDQDLLVANSTNGFNKLGLGADGRVLQSNGTALVYDVLDGGSF